MTKKKKGEKAAKRSYEELITQRAESRSVSLRERLLKETTGEPKTSLRETVLLEKGKRTPTKKKSE